MTTQVRSRRFVVMVAALVAAALAPLVAIAAPPPAPWFWTLASQREVVDIAVGEHTVAVEIADRPELHQRGLSYHEPLADDEGMLFVYAAAAPRSFWMKGMRFCLDIVWIEGGKIVGAAESVCPEPGKTDGELAVYPSGEPVTYVLELRAGWLEDHGYGAGTPVDLSAIEDAGGA